MLHLALNSILAILLLVGAAARAQQPGDSAPAPAAGGRAESEAAETAYAGLPQLQDVFFTFDSIVLDEQARRILDQNIGTIEAHPGARVLIEGHADATGEPAYNESLALERAKAVRDYLLAAGIPAARLAVSSRGERDPFDPRADPQARKLNRRVHLALSERVVVVNRVMLRPGEIEQLDRLTCARVPNGSYWLDRSSGLWGYAGSPYPVGRLPGSCAEHNRGALQSYSYDECDDPPCYDFFFSY